MRLQRALARAGVASRRAAEELIRGAKVLVNGQVAHIGMSVDADKDTITVQGRRVTQGKTVWIALHKPLGYVVTRSDPEGRDTVFKLLPAVPGLTYVGRLDVMTSGLLLLTTDGGVAHRLMHPRFEVERTYRVVVHGRTEAQIRDAFAKGIIIDGRRVNVVTLKIWPSEGGRRGSLELLLVLAEGRYRIVRRMCEQMDLKIERLVRLSYGPIRLGPLEPGAWRYLTGPEVAALNREKIGGSVGGRVESAGRRADGSGNRRPAAARSGEPDVEGPVGRSKRRFGKPGSRRPGDPATRRAGNRNSGKPGRKGAASRKDPASRPPRRKRDS